MHRSDRLGAPDVVALIMKRIENGRYRPGQRIIPADIAREIGSSPIPVREALCVLTGRDIMVEQRNKGFSVAPLGSMALRSLYAAHGEVVESALLQRNRLNALPGRLRKPWQVFRSIARQSGNEAVIDVQAYLANRLAIVRKAEQAHFADGGEMLHFVALLRQADAAESRALIRRFHEECQAAAVRIWQITCDV